jgi:hypothetical protein
MKAFKIIVTEPSPPMPQGHPDYLRAFEHIVLAESAHDALAILSRTGHVTIVADDGCAIFGAEMKGPVLSTPHAPERQRHIEVFMESLVKQREEGVVYSLLAQGKNHVVFPVTGIADLDAIARVRITAELKILPIIALGWNNEELSSKRYARLGFKFGIISAPESSDLMGFRSFRHDALAYVCDQRHRNEEKINCVDLVIHAPDYANPCIAEILQSIRDVLERRVFKGRVIRTENIINPMTHQVCGIVLRTDITPEAYYGQLGEAL